MISRMKAEEYMKSELPGILRVKLTAKIIVLRSLGPHFMHIRVNHYHQNCNTLMKNNRANQLSSSCLEVFCKKLFLRISQTSQETISTGTRVSF